MANGTARADQAFLFFTQYHLQELTGLRASTIPQLIDVLTQLPGSSVYFHTHQYLKQHQLIVPEPSNQFSSWVRLALDEVGLAEELATVDTVQYASIRSLRRKLIVILEEYLRRRPMARMMFARPGEEFNAVKTVSYIMRIPLEAHTLRELRDCLEEVTIDSIYFHLFEARLRLSRATNDFSAWLSDRLGEPALAQEFDSLSPYTMTLEDLRSELVRMINRRLKRKAGPVNG
jgi:hypothetical protein